MGRLAHIQYELCSSGGFQGPVAEKWSGLKARMENAPPGPERTRISEDIDQFASDFLYTDPRWKARNVERKEAQQHEAERKAAEQREAERRAGLKESRATANLDTSRCQPAVSTDCERLMRQLLHLQEAFLRTKPSSRMPPLKELVAIGRDIRSSLSREELRDAAYALDAWKQRNLPP